MRMAAYRGSNRVISLEKILSRESPNFLLEIVEPSVNFLPKLRTPLMELPKRLFGNPGKAPHQFLLLLLLLHNAIKYKTDSAANIFEITF